MADAVWKPRDGAPIEPIDALMRAARQLIPLAQSVETTGGRCSKTLSLDLADWGNPLEVTVNCTLGRQTAFAGRASLEFLFSGSIGGARQYRTFTGQALLDVGTGAVLAMEFDVRLAAQA